MFIYHNSIYFLRSIAFVFAGCQMVRNCKWSRTRTKLPDETSDHNALKFRIIPCALHQLLFQGDELRERAIDKDAVAELIKRRSFFGYAKPVPE